jgi:hypothetical protein
MPENFGAGEGIRTLDPNLGKVRVGRLLNISWGLPALLLIDNRLTFK